MIMAARHRTASCRPRAGQLAGGEIVLPVSVVAPISRITPAAPPPPPPPRIELVPGAATVAPAPPAPPLLKSRSLLLAPDPPGAGIVPSAPSVPTPPVTLVPPTVR